MYSENSMGPGRIIRDNFMGLGLKVWNNFMGPERNVQIISWVQDKINLWVREKYPGKFLGSRMKFPGFRDTDMYMYTIQK